jgi:H+/Cl- antiporter ClcA
MVTPLAFLAGWWLVYRFAPEAGGSGIPQVMAAIDPQSQSKGSQFNDRLLSTRTALIKVVSSLVCLAGGGAIGREGPTLQVSAAIFHFVGKRMHRFLGFYDKQMWAIAGASAGLASAFNTPLGGIVYAIEELSVVHFHRIRTALFSAVIVSGIMAQTLLGPYLYLGYPALQPINLRVWPWVFLTGAVAGIFGAVFSHALITVVKMRNSLKGKWKLAAFALACGCAAALTNFLVKDSEGPGTKLISRILFSGEAATFQITFARLLATGFAYISGAAGGVFSPALTIGACIGSKIAVLVGSPNTNLLAMLGMIGFLTGLTHTPFTSFILVLEMSDRHSAIFPMMIAAVVSHGAAKLLQKKSFYEILRDQILAGQVKESGGLPAS